MDPAEQSVSPETLVTRDRFQKVMEWAGPMIVLIGFACMLWLSWQRWADVLIDFGNQLYIPWRISEGEVLYRDLFYVFGVLSPYLHALIFKITGPGALYLSLFNIFLTIALTTLLYRMIRSLCGASTATLGALLFVTVHALGQHRYLANFNFIQPYSYDLTHGILLAFITLAIFLEYIKIPTTRKLIAIGLLSGLTLLTKIEVIFALGLAGAAGLGIAFRFHRMNRRRIMLNLFVLIAAFLVPAALVLLYFSTQMPFPEAVSNILLPIQYSLHPEVKTLPYYKWIKGTDALGENLAYMSLYATVLILITAALAKINQILDHTNKNTWPNALSAGLVIGILLWFFFWDIPWKRFLHPLPFLMIGASLFFVVQVKRHFHAAASFHKNTALLTLTLFSLFLLAKTPFRTGIYHYGFALSFPASLIVLLFITDIIPSQLSKKNRSLLFFQVSTTVLLVSYMVVMVYDSYLYYSKKNFPVGQGVDRFYEYTPNSRILYGRPFMEPMVTQFLLEYIGETMEPDARFSVFPDAVMINYLSRHQDPIGGFLMNPFTWVLVGGDAPIIQNLEANIPDYVILIDRKYTEWQMPHFGQDFGRAIHQWILDRYTLSKQIGAGPFSDSGFGVQIFKRQANHESASKHE